MAKKVTMCEEQQQFPLDGEPHPNCPICDGTGEHEAFADTGNRQSVVFGLVKCNCCDSPRFSSGISSSDDDDLPW